MNTPTPRTDAAWAKTFQDDEDQCRAGNAATDMRDASATLERELAALTAERDQLRAEVKESNERERVAIASWDEDRQRALREGGRVVELRTEVERWELAFQEQYARAESAEREVERLGHLEAVLRSSAADMTAGSITAGGVADLRAENERLRRAYVRPDDIRAQLESANARAVRAEAELAMERARLDYMSTRGFEHRHHGNGDHLAFEWTISSTNELKDVSLREVIDAAMKEETK